MKAPKFWNGNQSSLVPLLLSPLSVVYRFFDRLNRKSKSTLSASVPVICVGNAIVGGAGKTPVAISLAQYLIGQGWNVHFLSRGYGGQYKGPLRVVPDVHTALDVGDEPLLLASFAPTWISRDRVTGAAAAAKASADIIIMDDGFQNTSLKHDISFLVVDGGFGIGNGRILPSGPLREPIKEALDRADAVIVIGSGIELSFLEGKTPPIFGAKITPHALQKELVGGKVVAFAGIGRPEKFFDSLRDTGADVVETVEFPDHHNFSQEDIMMLVEKAAQLDAALVTTRKDYVRLSDDARMMTTVFDIDLVFKNPKELQKLLIEKLGTRQHA
ncbi:MAG: tetraacyldisaccharide 4'-kinase [Sneathiella sp.]|nr:tetraacyldisaccharide 4'-kinase [Sneathiella sp.]